MVGRPLRLFVAATLAMACGSPAVSAQPLPADLRITLERSGCGGTCPVYAVTIDAAGAVSFDGRQYVHAMGGRRRRVPVTGVAALMREAEQIGFFDLADDYTFTRLPDGTELLTVDAAVATLTIVHDGRTKRVIDGSYSPLELKRFADHIDAVTNTRPWLRLDAATLQAMEREQQPLSASELTAFLHTAVEHDDVDVVQLLLTAGADPRAANDAGFTPLGQATRGSAETARLLLMAGVGADQPVDETGRTALWLAACSGNRDVVQLLLGAGANPASRFDDRSALECARAVVGGRYGGHEPSRAADLPVGAFEQDFAETIRLLEQALAPPARRGSPSPRDPLEPREPPAPGVPTTTLGDAATR